MSVILDRAKPEVCDWCRKESGQMIRHEVYQGYKICRDCYDALLAKYSFDDMWKAVIERKSRGAD